MSATSARDRTTVSTLRTRLSTCSPTVSHDHVHISLGKGGGWGRTSWYAGRP